MFGLGFGTGVMGVVILDDDDCEAREAARALGIGLGAGPAPGGWWRGRQRHSRIWLLRGAKQPHHTPTATRARGGASCSSAAGRQGR